MITIMIHAIIKKDKLEQYLDLVKLLMAKTTKKGCVFYKFNQNKQEPTNFVLYEQWESQEALDNHMKELFEILGPAKPGYPVPARLMEMYDSATPVFYDVIG